MSPRTATLRGRTAAGRLMADTATVRRPGTLAFNPTTGHTAATATTVHTGRCWVRVASSEEDERVFGEIQVTAVRFVACFPHDVTDLEVGDIIDIASSDDPGVLGRSFRVLAVPGATWTLYKAYPCEVVE